jgi:hypothetical protein
MNNEFKKVKSNEETRYVLETATAGATSSGAVATVPGSAGKVQKRNPDNILAQEANKTEVPANKPRNFVAKNAKMGGAGAHKDKKKAQKQGQEKHKKPYAEDVEQLKARLENLKENLADQLAAFAKQHGGKVRTGPQPQKPQSAPSGDKPAPKPAPKYRDSNIDRSDDYSTWAAGRRDTTEGASDFVGNAIEDLRVSKPGMDIESFLDELYYYLDAEYGKRAADMVANADKDQHLDWYDDYNDMAEEGVAEGDNAEYDDEAGMADNNLETLERAVQGIDELINAGDNLPEWCQEKIAVAKSMLVTVWDYMKSEEDRGAANDDASDNEVAEEPDQYMESLAQNLYSAINEKAVSKAQQRFMGMVHAAQKGEKPASKEVAKAAKGMGKKDAKDFAATKHKGLPEKKPKK